MITPTPKRKHPPAGIAGRGERQSSFNYETRERRESVYRQSTSFAPFACFVVKFYRTNTGGVIGAWVRHSANQWL